MSRSGYLPDLRLLMRNSRQRLAAGLLLILLSSALDLLCISVLPGFVTWALSADHQALPLPFAPHLAASADKGHWLVYILLAVVALFLVRCLATILIGAYLSRLAQRIRRDCTERILAGTLRSPYEDILGSSVADGITVVTAHTTHFANGVILPLLRLIADLVTILALLAFLAWSAPELTLAVGIVLAFTAATYSLLVRRSSQKHAQRVVHHEGHLASITAQALQGSREVRIYQAQDFFSQEASGSLRGLEHAHARLGAIYWLPRALGELVLILIAIAYMVLSVRGGLTETLVLSNLSAFAFAGMRLLPAFAQSMVGVAMLRAGQAVTSLLATEVRRHERALSQTGPSHAASPDAPFESLQLKAVVFAYPGQAAVLDGVDLHIRKGQLVGVVGRSGAGKSTLGDVVLGLLRPQAGVIEVNGVATALTNPAWWDRVGFVPQNPFIANDTLARNVAYGLPDHEIDLAQLAEALQLAQMSALVERWPDGFSTRLGEAGVRLSGGQRQRVAIARALYRKRELLILDEATSALDDETEKEVIQALTALRGKVTMLAIAHRHSTLAACDLVVEARGGRLHETHLH